MQELIVLYDSSGRIAAEIAQVIDATHNDRLDGTLTLSFTSKVERVPEITPETSIAFRGQYYRATQVQSSASGGAFLLSVSCEQESISLVDYEIEEFNFTGSADDALARLLDGTGITATAEHTGTITISAQGGNRRSVLLEIVKLCEGELEYQGHHIRIVNRRGNGDPIDIVRVCRCTDCVKTLNLRDGSEGYEVSGVTAEGYGVGDEVILDFAPLGIHVQKRVVGVSYNPFNCTGVSVEIGEYITDITEDYAQLEKIFLLKADASIEFDKYINSAEGKAGIEAALSGSFVTKDALNGYVQTSELDAEIGAYLDGEKGVASITSAVSGKFMAAPPTVSYSTPSGVTYGFTKTSDGYYTSTNAGVNSSYSYGVFTFNNSSGREQEITLRCISYGENGFDFGIISTVNKNLVQSNAADTSYVLKSFKDASSATPVDVTVSIPNGTSMITFKYIKDGSQHSGGDCFKIMPLTGEFVTEAEMSSRITQEVNALGASLKLSVSNGEKSSTISLTKDGVLLSSQTIQFTGQVVFKSDLSTAGSTSIDGANITTGKISADRIDVGELSTKKVLFDDDNYNYNIISSEIISENNAVVTVGLTDYLKSSNFGQYLNLYGTQIYMIHTGYDLAAGDSDSYSLKFDMANRRIISGSSSWSIGYFENSDDNDSFGDAYFDYLYADRIYCGGRICMGELGETYPSLRYYGGELRWYTDSSEYTTLA